MGRAITKKILDVKLIKVEKTFNNHKLPKYFYNLFLEGIEEPIVLELTETIDSSIIGNKIKYYLNENFEISEFDII
jgi:hypothetical protein